MKTLLAVALFSFAISLAAFATPSYWAAVETAAYEGDASVGAQTAGYSAYYCTVDAANVLFGGSSVETVESYVQTNFAAVQAMAKTFDSVAFSDGEYQILHYVDAAFESSAYVAVALYGSEAFRVYGYESGVGGSARLTPYGQLVFNEAYATMGTVGDWRTVPEPTGGLLLLLGSALMALRRKRM